MSEKMSVNGFEDPTYAIGVLRELVELAAVRPENAELLRCGVEDFLNAIDACLIEVVPMPQYDDDELPQDEMFGVRYYHWDDADLPDEELDVPEVH